VVDEPVSRRARESGQVLLGVLLLAVLVSTVCLGYARHVVVAATNAQAAVAVQQAEGAADSGLVWAKQSLLSAGGRTARLHVGGDAQVAVNVVDNGSTLRTLTIQSSASGVTQAMEGSLETYATVADELPQLTTSARNAIVTHPALVDVVGSQSYSGTTLTGVIYLHNGAQLTLTNCIVAGTIVSQPALAGSWAPADCTTISLRGSIVIESDPALAGCSIVAPDATVGGDGSEALQIRGCIVCDSLSLTGWGALHGQIASTNAPTLNRSIELPGAGREPRAWPSALATGSERIGRVSFPRPVATAEQQAAICAFVFPPDTP
jgi:archaellum component FlaF (FlaF/FlaG flagellin family)